MSEIDWSLRLVGPALSEPLSLSQAKLHLKIDDSLTEEDDAITDYVSSAREYLEQAYNLRFAQQQVELLIAQFPTDDRFKLPIWPVQSVDYFRYQDIQNNSYDLLPGIGYLTRLFRKPCELVLPFGAVWPPITLTTADAIQVGLTVGYLRGDSPETLPVPFQAIQAMKLLIGHMYENHSAVTLGTLDQTTPTAMGVVNLMQNVRLF